jgi:hypothetical protein
MCGNGVLSKTGRILGLAVHKLVVAKRLEQIFEFRRQKFATLFR